MGNTLPALPEVLNYFPQCFGSPPKLVSIATPKTAHMQTLVSTMAVGVAVSGTFWEHWIEAFLIWHASGDHQWVNLMKCVHFIPHKASKILDRSCVNPNIITRTSPTIPGNWIQRGWDQENPQPRSVRSKICGSGDTTINEPGTFSWRCFVLLQAIHDKHCILITIQCSDRHWIQSKCELKSLTVIHR